MDPKAFDRDGNLEPETGISDAELDAMLAGALPSDEAQEEIMPEKGSPVTATVVSVQEGEILVELGQKTHGVIDRREYGEDEAPRAGETIQALFERYDRGRELAVLTVTEVRKKVLWQDIEVDQAVEGVVTETNRGGLILDIQGARAFVPLSQISIARVEDPQTLVGQRLRGRVTAVDRNAEELVVSCRALEQEAADERRAETIGTFQEGQVIDGTVKRVNEHGAFIDIGGVDGLLHMSKLRSAGIEGSVEAGQRLCVEVVHVDRERRRVGLELHVEASAEWNASLTDYEVGQDVSGLVQRVGTSGVVLLIDDGVEGTIPLEKLERPEGYRSGMIVQARIEAIDAERQSIILSPR